MTTKTNKPLAHKTPTAPRKVGPTAKPLGVEPSHESLTVVKRRHFKLYSWGFAKAAVIFAVSAWLATVYSDFSSWERSIFHSVNNMPDGLRIVGLIATVSPESTLIGAIPVVAAFLFKKYQLSWRLAVGIIGGLVVTMVAKHFIGRPRPEVILDNLHLRVHETGMGFPSGHTMAMTVVMLMLMPYVRGKWKLVLLLPIIATAWSRMYLGVHMPLDIIGGLAVGLGVVCFLRILPLPVAKIFRLE